MDENTQKVSPRAVEPDWMLIVQVLGSCLICLSLFFFFLASKEIFKGIWITAIPGFVLAATGIMLLTKRKAGCILLLGLFGLFTLFSILTVLGYGMMSDTVWFSLNVDASIYSVLWILGVFLFIRNRKYFA